MGRNFIVDLLVGLLCCSGARGAPYPPPDLALLARTLHWGKLGSRPAPVLVQGGEDDRPVTDCP
jgi:hypothetical protein